MKGVLMVLSMSIVLFGVAGCNTSISETTQPTDTQEDSGSTTGQQPQTPEVDEGNNNHEYNPLANQPTTQKTLTIHHNPREQETIDFRNNGFNEINITIEIPSDQEPVNYRLSQIIMPDGQSDGPFGRDTTYSLNQTGFYQLIFGESLMQGEVWSGTADITLNLAM